MAHTYMLFDFADEEKAQQARHKLETWKQAFRLDKKLQYKLDRGEAPDSDGASEEPEPEPAPKPAKGAKRAKSDKSAKSGTKSAAKAGGKKSDLTASSGPVKLLVRLYFSGHEKKSEQQWLDRIPVEEPFKAASPKVVQEGEAGFDEALADFDRLG
jgi:hypothetical protein